MPAQNTVISLSAYQAGRTNFQQHYFLDNCNTQFDGREVVIASSDFIAAIDNFIKNSSADPDTIALRFVHCYDPGLNILYLRMQICTMYPNPNNATIYILDTTYCEWYEIKGGTITGTSVTDLYDTNYLNYFYYCATGSCSRNDVQQLAADTQEVKYARNVVLPWGLEISLMYQQNGDPVDGYISFGAASYYTPNGPIAYQHTLYVSLQDSQKNPMMDDNIYQDPYEMKGCDLATVCPICCGVYVSAS
jgi:hypothetical protein